MDLVAKLAVVTRLVFDRGLFCRRPVPVGERRPVRRARNMRGRRLRRLQCARDRALPTSRQAETLDRLLRLVRPSGVYRTHCGPIPQCSRVCSGAVRRDGRLGHGTGRRHLRLRQGLPHREMLHRVAVQGAELASGEHRPVVVPRPHHQDVRHVRVPLWQCTDRGSLLQKHGTNRSAARVHRVVSCRQAGSNSLSSIPESLCLLTNLSSL